MATTLSDALDFPFYRIYIKIRLKLCETSYLIYDLFRLYWIY